METQHILNQNIHPLAIEICKILNSHNYQAFIVGGCVRDLLLGAIPKDWDITSNANPEQVMKIFPKTIPTGLQHGTVTVVMGDSADNHFEVTTFRIEGEYKDGRRPEEVFFVQDIEEDLSRRDLTINAIAYDPIQSVLIDPFEGIKDLKDGLIQAVGSPTIRFREDGLRIMRVARFAARFGYNVSESTLQGMKNNLDTLKKISKERISDELGKTLMANNPSLGLQILQDSGALDIACPLLASRQLPMLSKQNNCVGELETRLAFLYDKIDIAKVEKELLALKFSNKEVKKIVFLLRTLDLWLITQMQLNSMQSALAYRHFIAFIKNEAPETWERALEQFVILSKALETPIQAILDKYREQIVYSRKELQINGNDLITELSIKPGPQIKAVLNSCYQDILKYPEHNNKNYLLLLASERL